MNQREWHEQIWCVTARTNELEKQDKRFCLNPGVQSVFQNHQPLCKSPRCCLKQCVVCTEVQYGHQDEIQPAACFSSADMIVHRILLGARSDQLSYMLVPGSCRSQVCSSTLVCNRRVHHTVGMWRTLGFTVGYKLRTIFSSVLPQVQELRDAHLPWKDPTASAVHPSPLAFAPSPVSLTAG